MAMTAAIAPARKRRLYKGAIGTVCARVRALFLLRV
jgi:hypothetical protein